MRCDDAPPIQVHREGLRGMCGVKQAQLEYTVLLWNACLIDLHWCQNSICVYSRLTTFAPPPGSDSVLVGLMAQSVPCVSE